MIQINGALQIIPVSVSTDSGTLRVDQNQSQPAVVQVLHSPNGAIQVIYPVEAIDKVIEGLTMAREKAEKETVTDLYIPNSMDEADKMAKAQEALINEGKVEINEIGRGQN